VLILSSSIECDTTHAENWRSEDGPRTRSRAASSFAAAREFHSIQHHMKQDRTPYTTTITTTEFIATVSPSRTSELPTRLASPWPRSDFDSL
jgi:hypothetical protein